jgi:alkylation response protein AidB-like acyl-CoA dehydrogenase
VIDAVRRFVEEEVRPVAGPLDHADEYPHALVARMKALGLFGALVPERYGGLGLRVGAYARVIEELCRGWMSLAGVINSHTMAALIVLHHGTEAQRERFLPRFARGDARGGLALTEPQAGSDVQAIRTVARRRGDEYVLDGTKMFITNGREGNTFALLAMTDPSATPRHRGMSCFIVEKGAPGFRVVKSLEKLGYKGVDTAELLFEDFAVPAANLVGGVEGHGFKHVMSGLETGRINIAARSVGVAQAALEASLARCAAGDAPDPLLADVATRVVTARLLTDWAAAMKDRGERSDLEAGMAKLHASESAQQVAVGAMRLHGVAGQHATSEVERHYRDTPLMIIGEGTNEIQRLLIARHLLERYGERPGALTSRDDERDETRAMVLTVRQFVDKEVVPLAGALEAAGRYPAAIVSALADLGILGALTPVEYGGLALDLRTTAMIVEELARGSATVAAVVAAQHTATHTIARFGAGVERERLLPRMTRGEILGTPILMGDVTARRDGDGFVLDGTAPAVENAARVAGFLVPARLHDGRTTCFLVGRDSAGITLGEPIGTLGGRGLDPRDVTFAGVRVGAEWQLRGDEVSGSALSIARLGAAASALGLAQAAFEAALRYSQQRSAFGKPICQHQAIQAKLADMATAITAARLLTYAAATGDENGLDESAAIMAKIDASETAYAVTLESLRVHGGYGYVTEFPVERYYRDAARLLLTPRPNDTERIWLARRLAAAARHA